MRIARILTRLNLGGPARQALASDTLLARRGHELVLFTGASGPGEGDLSSAFEQRGLRLVRIPGLARGLSLVGDVRALFALRAQLRAFAPDIVHTHASKAGALGRRAARALGQVGRVHTFHGHVLEGYFSAPLSRGIVALERGLARETDRIVAVAHATADDLLRLGVVADASRLVVVPPGIELDALLAIGARADASHGVRPGPPHGALRAQLGVRDDECLAGVVGRLAEVKRPEWALDVFEMLSARYPRLHVVFVGDGDQRGMLERRIRAYDPERARRAHLAGAVVDMLPVLADLDLVLLTSRSEGLPIALIEAAAAAKPVVATDVGGVGEIVAHERTGFLCKDVDELAFGTAQLCDDAALRAAMGHRARVRVEKRHSASALAGRLEELYQAVLEERACAS